MYMASSQFRVLVGVKLDKKSLSALKNQIDGKSVDLKVNFNSKSILSELKAINATLKSLGKGGGLDSISSDLSQASSKASKVNSDFSRLLATEREIGRIHLKIAGLDATSNDARVLIGYLSTLETRAQGLRNSLDITSVSKGKLSTAQFDRLNDVMTQTTTNAIAAREKIRSIVNVNMGNGAFAKQLSQMAANLGKVQARSSTTTTAVKQVGVAFRELKAAQASGNTSAIISAYNNYNAALNAANNQIQRNIASEKRLMAAEKQHVAATRQAAAAKRLLNDKKSLDMSMEIWMKNNSAAAEQFGAKLTELRNKLKTCDATELNNLRSEFAQLKKEAQIAGVTGKTFGDRLKDQLKRYSSYLSVASAFMYGTMAIRDMARAVLEVDTAMTGLLRVTEMTANQTNVMYDKMIASAKEYGRTLTDTINATADWVRAGFDADTALGLAEKTAMYQNVSDLDYNEASENLLTSYNGFKDQLLNNYGDDEVAAVGHIVDVLNELDNKFSVTSAGLGEGLSRSASALQIAGNTFEESAA